MSPNKSGTAVSNTNAGGASASTKSTTGGTTTVTPQQTVTSTSQAPRVGNIIITEKYMSDPTWPADLRLDLGKSNWDEWSLQLTLVADLLGFTRWLEGSLPQPNITTYPEAHEIWRTNDRSLRAFMLTRVSRGDYRAVSHLQDSHSVFEELRNRHEHLGIHALVILLKKALNIRFSMNKLPLGDTTYEIAAIHTRLANMGAIDMDQLKSILLINALGDEFDQIQSAIQVVSAADSPGFSSNTIVRCIQQEDTRLQRRIEQGSLVPTALAATGRDRPRPMCSNCKRESHLTNYCIRPGGKLAGKTIEEARNAQRAASGDHSEFPSWHA